MIARLLFLAVIFFTIFSLGAYLIISSTVVSHRVRSRSEQVDLFSVSLTSADPLDSSTVIPPLSKASFKAAPWWYFDDIYRLDPNPRQTKCMESIRFSEDPEFAKAFLPNIELLLKRQNLTVTEWNRLAHFNNPYGFMGYNYTEIRAAIQRIPQPESEQILSIPDASGCIRCAVVATGGILNGSGMGKEIDAHDYVFRVNGAVVDGHEKDVGRRTSVYVHTSFSLISASGGLSRRGFKIPQDENQKQEKVFVANTPSVNRFALTRMIHNLAINGIKYVLIPEGGRDFNFLKFLIKDERISSGDFRGYTPRGYYKGNFNESRYYVLHPDFLRYVKNRFLPSLRLKGTSWAIYRPTNGAYALFLAMHTCDTVSAYGYSTLDYKKYSTYYYDRGHSRMVFFANHDNFMEINTWKRFHDNKLIKLYQGNNTTLQ